MVRFNATMLEVRDFNEFVIMLMLKQGLKSSYLIFYFDKNFSKDYIDFLVWAQKYAQAKKGWALCQ